jgi:hypothetical protein
MDTMNKFLVSSGGVGMKEILVMNPPRGLISKEDALNLAAWLIVISGTTREEVEAALSAVEDT